MVYHNRMIKIPKLKLHKKQFLMNTQIPNQLIQAYQ